MTLISYEATEAAKEIREQVLEGVNYAWARNQRIFDIEVEPIAKIIDRVIRKVDGE